MKWGCDQCHSSHVNWSKISKCSRLLCRTGRTSRVATSDERSPARVFLVMTTKTCSQATSLSISLAVPCSLSDAAVALAVSNRARNCLQRHVPLLQPNIRKVDTLTASNAQVLGCDVMGHGCSMCGCESANWVVLQAQDALQSGSARHQWTVSDHKRGRLLNTIALHAACHSQAYNIVTCARIVRMAWIRSSLKWGKSTPGHQSSRWQSMSLPSMKCLCTGPAHVPMFTCAAPLPC